MSLFVWGFSASGGSTDAPNASVPWEAAGYTVTRIDTSNDRECVSQAYGQVQQFFAEHPCSSLHRSLFKAEDSHGNMVVIAASRTDMPNSADAEALGQLADQNGSGNVSALEQVTVGNVSFTGSHYASQTEGSVVNIAEAEPIAGYPSTATMRDLAKRALEHA